MVSITTSDDTLRAVDPASNALAVTVEGWEPTGARPIPDRSVGVTRRDVDGTVTGHASALRFDRRDSVRVERPDGHRVETIQGSGEKRLRLEGEHVVTVQRTLRTTVHFDATATLDVSAEGVVLSFEGHPRVTVGFADAVDLPEHTVTVPRTPDGVATALSTFGTGHADLSTAVSLPSVREHPPRVAFGERTDVPERVRTPAVAPAVETVVEVPPRAEALFPVAPLAYYLGATVRVAEGPPRVRAPEISLDHRLPAPPELADAVAGLLRRTVYLDAAAHAANPREAIDLVETDALAGLEIDPNAVNDMAPAERVQRYLSADFASVADRFPEWPFAAYVEPDLEHAETLPYLVRSLPTIHPPETRALEKQELLSRAQAATYRAGGEGEVPTVERVDPVLGDAEVHGWLADGRPIDVFKSLPAAYRNRQARLSSAGGDVSVTVVLNDEEMVDEHEAVTRIYRDRVEDTLDHLEMRLDIHESLTTAELAERLESDTDFLHYIGHCETGGLRCPDGTLSAASLSRCGAQTFFLNACGSYYEAVDLVEQGAVAGAATFREVTNRHAAQIGTAFARLMMRGFSIWRALDLARRRAMAGKDYLVVGDGLHRLTQTSEPNPVLFEVTSSGDDYRLAGRFLTHTDGPGGYYGLYLGAEDRLRLFGAEFEREFDRDGLLEFLGRNEAPVIVDGEFHWTTELETVLE